MNHSTGNDHHTLCFQALGIDYKQASLSVRGRFSLEASAQQALLLEAGKELPGVLLLSTCNRTELYSVYGDSSFLKKLLSRHCQVDMDLVEKHTWYKEGLDAVEHLFRVSGGLESNILGDLQIINQVKRAWKVSQEHQLSHSLMQRWVEMSIQCSKQIKKKTKLSSGSASISYTAVQSIDRWMEAHKVEKPKILVLGLGEIGRNSAFNILKYLPKAELYVSNRNQARTEEFVSENGAKAFKWEEWGKRLNDFEVILTATASPTHLIEASALKKDTEQLLIDLAVPRNIDPEVRALASRQLIDLDQLGSMQDETLAERQSAIPQAEEIIEEGIQQFNSWLARKQFSPLISWLKTELTELQKTELERYQRRNPEADISSAQAVSQHLIHSLTAKVARFINSNHQDLADEFISVQTKIQSQG